MSCLKRFWRRLSGKTSDRILLLGLDNAGKTTMLHRLKGKMEKTIPTIGFNVETIKWGPVELVVWDIGGQDKLRSFWRHYYHGTNGLVFIIDSADTERFNLVAQELTGLVHEEELDNATVLILANKSDLKESLSAEELKKRIDFNEILKGRKWHLQPCSAATGEGTKEGIDWLSKNLTPT